MSEEWFDLVDEQGNRIGRALRQECHGNPELLRQAVHVLVQDAAGRLFLQKRAMNKDIQPGKWDTSVGGHLQEGESPEDGVRRELQEELGLAEVPPLTFAYQYLWRTEVESELVRTFVTTHEGPFNLQEEEIDDGRFWSPDEIEEQLGKAVFTPNFEIEYKKFQSWSAT